MSDWVLKNEDCLQFLSNLEDESVDLIVLDPLIFWDMTNGTNSGRVKRNICHGVNKNWR